MAQALPRSAPSIAPEAPSLYEILAAQGQDVLRFLTCGSVDDGKSTLIGRLLFQTRHVAHDHLAALERDSRRFGTTGEELDFALLVDGLEDERSQGITIDVAYRYFSTARRYFIVADTPGHEQYTRNMATGASTCDLAVILVDARAGVVPQTMRHAGICSLLGIREIVLAVNKMDLLGFDQEIYDRLVSEFMAFSQRLEFAGVTPIPLSARYGDNVTERSARTPWYAGPSLLEHLETVGVSDTRMAGPLRVPVQWVNRPNPDFRGYAGTIASGALKIGDTVALAPSGRESRVMRIISPSGDVTRAGAGEAVTITIADEIDMARGDVLAAPESLPKVADQFAAHLIWMAEEPLLPGRQYLMRIGTRYVRASVTAIRHKLDIETLNHLSADEVACNEIAICNIATDQPVVFDPYRENRSTGSFILIDRYSNATVGAGMIDHELMRASNLHEQKVTVDKAARTRLTRQKPAILWFTGLSGAGKSTIADLVERRLHDEGHLTYLLDGDNIRLRLNRDLGFTDADRVENIRRVGEVARLFVDSGLIVLCSFISPFAAERQSVRELVRPGEFFEIFVDAPLETCIARDPKQLYAKARDGRARNVTGIDSPYEPPVSPDLHLRSSEGAAASLAEGVVSMLRERGVIGQGPI